MRALRRHLTYANVMSTIAVFVVLGGGAYAAATITGGDVKDRSLTGKDVKRNSLTGKQVAEARLGAVPRARNAARVGGRSAASLLVRCPSGTIALASICIETQPRPAAPYSDAIGFCDRVDRPATTGRRLPSHDELRLALGYDPIDLAPGGELTRDVQHDSNGGPLQILTVVTDTGGTALVPNNSDGRRPFRCVANPSN
jgi:hypothetical protein